MTELLRNWVLGLTGAAAVCAAALTLTPRGQVRKVVELLCGVVMAAALLSPLMSASLPEDYSLNLAKYRAAAEALTENGTELSQSLDRSIIEEKLEAYILDKAQTFGAAVSAAQVSVRWSAEGVWVPESVVLTGAYDADLARSIEAELGIPRSAQSWRSDEND